MELWQWVLLGVVAVFTILYILKRFFNIDLLTKVVTFKPILTTVIAVLTAVQKLLPNPYLSIILVVLKAAATGAEQAEKLWLIGQLDKEARNDYAKKWARETLESSGLVVTEPIEKIISGIIEVVCILLPHGVTPTEPEKITE
jgi:hypothetical protein